MASLRAAIITDIHCGPDYNEKLGSRAPSLIRHFTKAVQAWQPDVVIDIGDRITAHNAEDARRNMRLVKSHFNVIAQTAPVFSVIGNHDVYHLSRAENERIMGLPAHSYSRDVSGYHLVFWNPSTNGGVNFLAPDEGDIRWLADDLKHTQKPTIVFSHVPFTYVKDDRPDPQQDTDIITHVSFAQERLNARLRALLDGSGKVILCVSGHIHKNSHCTINDIPYVTQQSLVYHDKSRDTITSRTYSLLECKENTIQIKIRGRHPHELHFTPQKGSHRYAPQKIPA